MSVKRIKARNEKILAWVKAVKTKVLISHVLNCLSVVLCWRIEWIIVSWRTLVELYFSRINFFIVPVLSDEHIPLNIVWIIKSYPWFVIVHPKCDLEPYICQVYCVVRIVVILICWNCHHWILYKCPLLKFLNPINW